MSWQSDQLSAFEAAWSRFCRLRCELEQRSESPESSWNRLAQDLGIPQKLITLGARDEVGALEALDALVEIHGGRSTKTGGMLGGSGNSLYMDTPKELLDLTNSFGRLCNRLEKIAKPT